MKCECNKKTNGIAVDIQVVNFTPVKHWRQFMIKDSLCLISILYPSIITKKKFNYDLFSPRCLYICLFYVCLLDTDHTVQTRALGEVFEMYYLKPFFRYLGKRG